MVKKLKEDVSRGVIFGSKLTWLHHSLIQGCFVFHELHTRGFLASCLMFMASEIQYNDNMIVFLSPLPLRTLKECHLLKR